MISMIWAEDLNGGIGIDNRLPWNLPEDLKYFREKTINKVVVMGFNTFKSLDFKPLPKRNNIVLLDMSRPIPNVGHYDNLTFIDLKQLAAIMPILSQSTAEIMVIGGKSIYEQFMFHADYIYRTTVHGRFDCDTQMGSLDLSKWHEIDHFTISSQSGLDLTFSTFKRFAR